MGISMDTNKIREALIKEAYPKTPEFEKTVDRLSHLEGEAKDMLLAWINYGIEPIFSNFEGINSDDLREKVGMKTAAIILAFDMLTKHPETTSFYERLIHKHLQYKPQKL